MQILQTSGRPDPACATGGGPVLESPCPLGGMVNYDSMTRAELIALIDALNARLADFDADGGTGEDSTESRQVDNERERYFERSPQPMYIHDRETTRFLKVNDAALRLYGYSHAEFLALTLAAIHLPEQIPAMHARQSQRTGYVSYRGARRHRKKTGEVFEVEVFAQDVTFNGRRARVTLLIDTSERKRAEEELRQQKQLLDTVIDNLPVGLTLKDANTLRFLRRNRISAALNSYLDDECIGKTAFEIFPRERAEAVNATDLQALATRAIVDIPENPIITMSGEVRIRHTRKVPILDAHGQPQVLVTISDDITERKRAQDARRESERFAHSVIDALSKRICVIDAAGTIIAVNKAWREFESSKGGRENVLEAANYLAVCDGADCDSQPQFATLAAGIRSVMNGECDEFSFEYPCHAPAEQRWFMAKVTRFHGDGPLRVVITHENITTRKLAEQALAESEERFRLLAENVRDVFWIATPNLEKMLYVSPAFEHIWGMDRDRIYKDPNAWMEPIDPEDLGSVRAAVASSIGGECSGIEYRIVAADGGVRWIRDRSYTITTGDGKRLACGIAEDVSERKRMEAERLAREIELRETMVREVHHRLKNHLQGITGLLRRKGKGNPGLGPALDAAVAELQAVAAGLQNHATNGRAELRTMLEATIASIEGLTGAQLSLNYQIAGQRPAFIAENEQVPLALVLNELIFNAFKHGVADRRTKNARIAVSMRAGLCAITVANDGKLPPGFNFSNGRGIGLGLELVRDLLPSKSAALMFTQADGTVTATLALTSPLLVVDVPLASGQQPDAAARSQSRQSPARAT